MPFINRRRIANTVGNGAARETTVYRVNSFLAERPGSSCFRVLLSARIAAPATCFSKQSCLQLHQ